VTRPRYEIISRVVSPKGEGAFPEHHDMAYVVIDNETGNEINCVSTREAAEERVEIRKEYNRRRDQKK
jgi:hypothetical protein